MVQYDQADSRRKVASICIVISVFDNGDDTFTLVIRHKHERIPKAHFEAKLDLLAIKEKRSGNKFGHSLVHKSLPMESEPRALGAGLRLSFGAGHLRDGSFEARIDFTPRC
jgi:hypothetical protein